MIYFRDSGNVIKNKVNYYTILVEINDVRIIMIIMVILTIEIILLFYD